MAMRSACLLLLLTASMFFSIGFSGRVLLLLGSEHGVVRGRWLRRHGHDGEWRSYVGGWGAEARGHGS